MTAEADVAAAAPAVALALLAAGQSVAGDMAAVHQFFDVAFFWGSAGANPTANSDGNSSHGGGPSTAAGVAV